MEAESKAAIVDGTGLVEWAHKNAQHNAVLLVLKRYSDADIITALIELGISEDNAPLYVDTARRLVLIRKKKRALWGIGLAIVFGIVAIASTLSIDTKMYKMLGIDVRESYVGMWMVLAVCAYNILRNGWTYLSART